MSSYQQQSRSEVTERVFQATYAFLKGRLADAGSVEWAVCLTERDHAQRAAVSTLLERGARDALAEPWSTAWQLIEESWSTGPVEPDSSLLIHEVKRRLKAGNRSGALIDKIVAAVAPILKVSPFSELHQRFHPRPTRARSVRDLFSVRITSGRSVDPDALGLSGIADAPFLTALASALEFAVGRGLDMARRLGWDGTSSSWQIGQLHRVYFVRAPDLAPGANEPDQFHTGIAPSVKLLHATTERLAELESSAVAPLADRWRTLDGPVYSRLWAAIARDPRLASADDVGQFLLSRDSRQIWSVYSYPEIAELRARRFAEFDTATQGRLLAQLSRGPPLRYWRRDLTTAEVAQARAYWKACELQRLEIGGFELPDKLKAWLDDNAATAPNQPMRLDEGFPGTTSARWIGAPRETRYDHQSGTERLAALESALSTPRSSWTDDPAESAGQWIREGDHPLRVLTDLEGAPDGGAAYPNVWDRFGWAHAPRNAAGQSSEDQAQQVARVLALLTHVPDGIVRTAIEGLASWISAWSELLSASPSALPVWLRLWPVAVEATNARTAVDADVELESVIRPTADSRSVELDTLNTPVGKLIEMFLRACPSLNDDPAPFSDESLRRMRDEITDASGNAGLIAKYRLIESIDYFQRADQEWTDRALLQPLESSTVESLQLWKALSRRIHSRDVLTRIGNSMAERAVDDRLERDTRHALLANLVVEGLYSIKEQRDPVVARSRIQQTIRAVEDEVRAHAADTVRRFVSELSADEGAERLLHDVASPFMSEFWPQERSLATPGVSKALAALPAASQGAFADAVDAIKRFLVPFDCWSMLDYGLFGEEDGRPRLEVIDSPEKAKALLVLLDCTVGQQDEAVIPLDLSEALERVRSAGPSLVNTTEYRRLATAARRT